MCGAMLWLNVATIGVPAMRRSAILLFLLSCLVFSRQAAAVPAWLSLPPTPALPTTDASGYVEVNRVKIWYATFGSGPAVILLHGGLANGNYWGEEVPVLARH